MHKFLGPLSICLTSKFRKVVAFTALFICGSAKAAMSPAIVPSVSDTLFNAAGFPFEGGCQYYDNTNLAWNSSDANCLTNTPVQASFPLIIRINTNRDAASLDARYDYDIAIYTDSSVTNITYNGVSTAAGKYYVPSSSFTDTVNMTMQYDFQGRSYRFLVSKNPNSHTLNSFSVVAINQTSVGVPTMPTWSLGMLALLLCVTLVNIPRRQNLKSDR